MVSFVRNFSGSQIYNWLMKFGTAVEQKEYLRIDYATWRDIKNLKTSPKVSVKFIEDVQRKQFRITFYSQDTTIELNEKNNFGQFLFKNNFFLSAEDTNKLNDMAINTATTTWSNATTTVNSDYSTYSTITIPYGDCGSSGMSEIKNSLEEVKNNLNNLKKEMENKNKMANTNMNTMFNFDFGPINQHTLRMSMYGYAIPNRDGKYVSYDAEHDRLMDVQVLNFNCDNMFYKVPKPLNKISDGDVVFHNGIPMFVEEVNDNRLTVIDPQDGTEKTILALQSPFGFDYVTTLISLMDGFCEECEPDEDNPFGNILPFILMSNNGDMNNTLPLLMMMNGKMNFDNPMMLLAMSNGNFDTNNPLMLMALMKSFNK